MSNSIQCPHCGQTYQLTDEQVPQYAGQTIDCTNCGKAFTVPATPGTIAPPPLPVAALHYNTPAQFQNLRQRSNGFAITSVVCGAVGFIIPLIPAIFGLIFGILGLRRTRDPEVGGKSMAITGIALSGATLLILPCMISILLPSLSRARQTAQRVQCASNMRQIGAAMIMYANTNRGMYPPRLEDLILSQSVSPNVFVCASSNDTPAPGTTSAAQAQSLSAGGHLSYVYVRPISIGASAANTVVLYEPPSNHSNDGGNVLFADGHVAFIRRQTLQLMISQLNGGQNPPAAVQYGY